MASEIYYYYYYYYYSSVGFLLGERIDPSLY